MRLGLRRRRRREPRTRGVSSPREQRRGSIRRRVVTPAVGGRTRRRAVHDGGRGRDPAGVLARVQRRSGLRGCLCRSRRRGDLLGAVPRRGTGMGLAAAGAEGGGLRDASYPDRRGARRGRPVGARRGVDLRGGGGRKRSGVGEGEGSRGVCRSGARERRRARDSAAPPRRPDGRERVRGSDRAPVEHAEGKLPLRVGRGEVYRRVRVLLGAGRLALRRPRGWPRVGVPRRERRGGGGRG